MLLLLLVGKDHNLIARWCEHLCLFKDFALVKLLAVKVALPGEVLLDHGLGLLVIGVELCPIVRLVVDGQVIGKLGVNKKD